MSRRGDHCDLHPGDPGPESLLRIVSKGSPTPGALPRNLPDKQAAGGCITLSRFPASSALRLATIVRI